MSLELANSIQSLGLLVPLLVTTLYSMIKHCHYDSSINEFNWLYYLMSSWDHYHLKVY